MCKKTSSINARYELNITGNNKEDIINDIAEKCRYLSDKDELLIHNFGLKTIEAILKKDHNKIEINIYKKNTGKSVRTSTKTVEYDEGSIIYELNIIWDTIKKNMELKY